MKTEKDFNESLTSSIKESHSHDNMDCDQHINVAYDVNLSLISLSCQSFSKDCSHDPIIDSLEESYRS